MIYILFIINIIFNLFVLYYINNSVKSIMKMFDNYFPTCEYEEEKQESNTPFVTLKYDNSYEYVEQLIDDENYNDFTGVEVLTNEEEKASERKRRGY